MTPKEKAKQLVDDFIYIDNGEMFQIIGVKQRIRGKQCALIAVDLILHDENINHEFKSDYDYWIEVKKEIELL